MILTTLKDVVDSLAKSLHISTSFPSLLFVFLNVHFVIPTLPFFENKTNHTETTVILLCCSLVFSFSLYAFNSPLIQFFEGCIAEKDSIFNFLHNRHKSEFQHITQEIDNLQDEWREKGTISDQKAFKLARLDEKINLYYPPKSEQVLPTKVGNIIAAFENYPRRYGIDSIALWTRLVPILKNNNYLQFVSNEKIMFDFLMNMSVVTLFLGLEFSYLYLYHGKLINVLVTLSLTGFFFWLFYQGMIHAARYWGEAFCVAFDLYRGDLYKKLNLKPAKTFKEEYERWEKVSQFFLFRRDSIWFDEFQYPEEWDCNSDFFKAKKEFHQ
jgi:hypothetical protein